MRWIDFKGKDPTQPFADWNPWTQKRWDEWKAEANRLAGLVAALNEEAVKLQRQGQQAEALKKIAKRNDIIDKNSAHWGKLKDWLLALSYGKCWFTEARDIASHKEIEHFRPKKVAVDLAGNARDGYWWLAFDYTNFRVAGNVPNRKKGGWFPLAEGSHTSKYDQRCEESEQPYLLDPTNDADPGLLAFDEEGNAVPVPGANEWDTKRVDESIKRLKLNDHDALPTERRRLWQKMSTIISEFLDAKQKYNPQTNPMVKVTIEEKARQIRELTRPEAELSAVARWCVLFRNDGRLSRLIS
jgi:uncharacterized protein (TIGR02646 family)